MNWLNLPKDKQQELFNISEKTAFRDLDKLVEKGILTKKGDKKGAYY